MEDRTDHTIVVPADVHCPGQGLGYLAAGTYRVTMPADYDPSAVTGEDIVCDGQLAIVVIAEVSR